ncbi:AMP-dependent synthetase/ligase [Nesterenkonia sandarakina]|uniref:Acyl-CoA synthetase n=1 Tax=Nesterenkonia sandarakina TaxID=272918 RepID=A0A7Z0E6V6_9MICC|nr:AMP-dependent synthetase/ligase [Nesterenkonia sandarakina]NYJ15569.1 long-chain acyl-CoA synthetase [Nesterenkonia sandarakina]
MTEEHTGSEQAAQTSSTTIREAATAQVAWLQPERNATDGVLDLFAARPNQPVYAVPNGTGGWVDVSITSFLDQVRGVAKGLIALGLEPGDRIAVMAPTSYNWAVVDQAIWFTGAISVPIYETSSQHQVGELLEDSGAKLALAGSSELQDCLRAAGAKLKGNRPTVLPIEELRQLDDLAASGEHISDEQLEAARSRAGLDDVATLVYTSGTTGRPKGVRITHRNLAEGAANMLPFADEILGEGESRTLIFLPLAHVLARAVQLMCLHRGVQVAHSPGSATLLEDLASFRPTWLLGVPRVFEKVYHGAATKARAEGKGKIFEAARETAVAYSRALQVEAAGEGPGPSVRLRARRAMFARLVYSKLHARLGGSVRYMISGASTLNSEIAHFFTGIGLPVQEGYGLTESTAPITLNIPGATRIGTVGIPVPGNTVRIAADSEVLLKGPVVFDGYHNKPEATAESFDDDGFFRTGDLGTLDEDGFLTLTGRKKDLIVTAGGKNVYPMPMEEVIRAHPLVAQALVVGDDRPYVAALVTLDADAVADWCRLNGYRSLSLIDAAKHPKVRQEIGLSVEAANRRVSRAESIRKFELLDVELSEESGYLTPSLKLQRHRVLADFQGVIDSVYAN